MKLIRLRLDDYKGVSSRDIRFADSGITIVQGPNEIGKSSLAEAIGVIFEMKASAGDKTARAMRPVHRDADPHILIEATSGPYHFIYEKTFRPRGGSTSLRVLEPAAERNNYTADAAHNKANQILRDTLDKDLWDALIIRQGDMIRIPDLKGRVALMAALDAAAGGVAMDRQAESLYEAVEKKYLEYHTRDGKRGDVRSKAEKAVAAARELYDSLKARLDEAEAKSRRADDLQERIVKKRADYENAVRDRDEARARATAVHQAETALAAATAERERAANRYDQAKRREADRDRLVQELKAAEDEATTLHELLSAAAVPDDTDSAFEAVAASLEAARERAAKAEADLAEAMADERYFEQRQHRDILKGAVRAYRAAEREYKAATDELGKNTITDAVLGEIAAAERVYDDARFRLEAEAPRVTVRGLGDAVVLMDGREQPVTAEYEESRSVEEAFLLTVPGSVSVHVEARISDELIARRADAEDRLRDILGRYGVDNAAAAAVCAEKRRRAAETRLRAQQEMARSLGNDSIDAAEARLREVDDAIARHRAERSDSPFPADRDSAAERRRLAGTEHQDAQNALAAMQARFDAERETRSERAMEQRAREERAALAEAARRRLAERLREAEAAEPAAALAAAATEDASRCEEAERDVRNAEKTLADLNPERAAHMLETFSDAVDSLAGGLEQDARELGQLTGELLVRGDSGLFDRVQEAERDLAEAEERRDRLERAAAAARLLYETMRRHRAAARREYTEPLKRKVEELGRWVTNDSFSVELDDESLSVKTRTQDGVTVPFDSLSGGTREQLSLIFRAACSMIVSESEGMPLILDDVLGYSDPDRLKMMNSVLAHAARGCQILVFTCDPERYAFVGRAKVIDLS